MPEMTLADLQREYDDGESCDKEIFSEQRSNILLVASEHYAKKGSKYYNRIRDQKELPNEQKIRLTKNHVYKIMRLYSNVVVNSAPGVMPTAQDPKDLADQKSAELHASVWKYAKKKYKLKEKIRNWAEDFTTIGEVGCKIFFDPTLGKQVGWEPETGPDGQPVLDEMGQPKASKSPIYSGDFVFETFFGFNLLRKETAKSMDESPWLTIRKMVSVKDMQKRYEKDEDKKKMFDESQDETYLIFDMDRSAYGRSKGQVMVCETFYRPCMLYPNGYYYFWTKSGIFEEGELPFGIWPVAYGSFDRLQTTPRGRSHIKILRPFQAEINRASSKMAEHQITLGDDKVLIQAGTKLQQGGILPGVRGISVSGAAPQILPGRDGSQYLPYIQHNIAEMYKASLIEEESIEKAPQQDPHTLLYRAASQKKKFSLYVEKFEQYLADICHIFLEQARHYLPDEELIEAVGKTEIVNIFEFKNPKRIGYQITIEPIADDIETKMGKMLRFQNVLQYMGSKLEREDLGKLMKEAPYSDSSNLFEDFTLNYDSGTNLILALDRGEQPQIGEEDDPPYMIRRITNRMRKPDFRILPPQIQQLYKMVRQEYQKLQAQILQKQQALQNDMIPSGGALVVVDLYVQDPKNPLSSKRARLPYESINWLIQRLQDQGTTLEMLQQVEAKNAVEIAQMAGVGRQPPVPVQAQGSQPVGYIPGPQNAPMAGGRVAPITGR